MPEGDTVWRAARNLDRALAGAPIISSDFRVPHLAVASLSGSSVVSVRSVGKHILMRFSNELTLHSHLRMDGDWVLLKSDSRRKPGPSHEIRVILSTPTWTAVGVRLHDLALVPTGKETEQIGYLGPDLLGLNFDLDAAAANLTADPRAIAEALLDQRNLAGIGNIYKAEVLFLCGIHPLSPAHEVADVRALVRTARRLLLANREHPEQSTTGDLRRGHTHWVYGRAGQPCRRCGHTIQIESHGDPLVARVTFWCPNCQSISGPANEGLETGR